MNRVLIIEDEQALQESLSEYLGQLGYEVETADGYCQALAVLDHLPYDCLLVDLNLPDGDGLKIIEIVRENESNCGILIISARDTVEERVKGLGAGADDYLVKPFHLAEMGARVQSIIRRLRFDGETVIRLGELVLDPENNTLKSTKGELEITPKEKSILSYLISNKNRVITKEIMAEHIWGDDAHQLASFDPMYTHIKNLRKKIQFLTGEDWLKTVYGVGYKLSVPK